MLGPARTSRLPFEAINSNMARYEENVLKRLKPFRQLARGLGSPLLKQRTKDKKLYGPTHITHRPKHHQVTERLVSLSEANSQTLVLF